MVSQTEPRPLNPQPVETAVIADRGFHGYYRKPDGWIVVGSLTPSNRSGYEFKGFQYLQQYGAFKNGTNTADARQNERDANGAPWNPAWEPYRLFFQKGGASEFPVEQIIAYQWHIRPPYTEITFPQLDGVSVVDIDCPECDKIFSGTSVGVVAQNLRQHLSTRMDARHSYTPSDIAELGEELGVNLQTARTRVKPIRVSIGGEEQEVAEVPELMCACGWTPKPRSKRPEQAFNTHQRMSKHGAYED